VVTPPQQRAAADYLTDEYRISQRHAARVLGRARSSVRYRPRQRSGEAALVKAIRRLARRHVRFGYKRIHALLRRDGWRVNVKRVRRLWMAMGLRRPRRKKPTKHRAMRGSSANSCVNRPARFKNDVWTCDLIFDRTRVGGSLKCLSLVDEYTRECLALVLAHSVSGELVRRTLGRVIARRGAPKQLRSDNGGEFINEALRDWLPQRGAESIPVAPASPWENGFIESFHSRLRDEFLNVREFESAADAQAQADWWRREYNTVRPHSSLGYRTPREFSDECDAQGRTA
jgi:transposase InsO family protein